MSPRRFSLPAFALMLLSLGVLSLGLAACSDSAEQTPAEEVAEAAAASEMRLSREQIAADVTSAMDTSVDPCQDFYQYACGGWLEKTERPPDQPRWGRSFSTIREANQVLLREIVQDAADKAAGNGAASGGTEAQQVGDFYNSCMDQAGRDAAGIQPLAPLLAKIEAVEDREGLFRLAAELHRKGSFPLFDAEILPDFKTVDVNLAYFHQAGMGLPEKDYYFREDEASRALLQKYEEHIARMLGLLGTEPEAAASQAREILAFETKLASFSRSAVELRDIEKLYNRVELAGFKELTPQLPWTVYLEAAGYPGATQISVATPEFFEGIEDLLAETSMPSLKNYLRWQLILAYGDVLSDEISAASFEFYGRALNGQEEREPLWKRCIDATDAALGELVGRLFVDRAFAGDSKEKAVEMIGDIQEAFRTGLPALAWMDEETRTRALEKAQAVTRKIGYPDEWRDYSSVEIRPGQYFANAVAASRFNFDFYWSKVGEPVDPTEWRMTPPTVNAYYNPTANEIVFPAGILQPPFFHRDFPAAMNYGAIGMVMGHELTHGFDDTGRKFDAEGRLREWWQPEVAERFEERAACVKDLYDTYEVEPGLTLNGELTLGENIADLGGIKQAYKAYQSWKGRHGQPEPLVEGLTDDQLFFVSFGQIWCSLATPEFLRLRTRTDSHSMPRYRVIGPVSNFPVFAETFNCPQDAPMRQAQVCEVW